MQGITRCISIVLAAVLISTAAASQDISWLKGTWYGKSYLPGSDVTQSYLLILRIYATKDNRFEGIISAVQPSDTSIRYDTQVIGVVYENYLLIHRERILYVKNGPNVRWKVSCNNCKPPRMIFSLENGKFTFKGEQSDCYKECNGINEFAKNVDDFDSTDKKSLYAKVNLKQPETEAVVAVATNAAQAPQEPVFERLKLPPAQTAIFAHTSAASSIPRFARITAFQIPRMFRPGVIVVTQKIPVSAYDSTSTVSSTRITAGKPPKLLTGSARLLSTREIEPMQAELPAAELAMIVPVIKPVVPITINRRLSSKQSFDLGSAGIVTPKVALTRADTVTGIARKLNLAYFNHTTWENRRITASLIETHIPTPKIMLTGADTVMIATVKAQHPLQKHLLPLNRQPGGVSVTSEPVTKPVTFTPGDDVLAALSRRPQTTLNITGKLRTRPSLTVLPPAPITAINRIPVTADTISLAANKPALTMTGTAGRNAPPVLPDGYAERKKNLIRTITVNTDSVVLRVYDNGVVDGDIVSVIYNDKVVIDKLSLTTRAVEVKIPVTVAQANTLVFHAHNLGEFPPNTAKLEIIYGNKKEELTVSSDLTVSSTIDIEHE